MKLTRGVLSFAVVLGLAVLAAVPASAQTATLLDGTVLTRRCPLELFATEGPMWDVDVATQGITVVGKIVTIPATINGVELAIFGSSVLGQDGEAATGITAATFDRLLDSNAIGADVDLSLEDTGLGPRRLGPGRSIFSTSEGRRLPGLGTADLERDNVAQAAIEANYFAMVQACYPAHAAVLPANFLELSGLRGNDPSQWVYPTTAGGTLKSAGHVYFDAAGNEYLIPDIEVVIELSENVSTGPISSLAAGGPGTPDSFVIGDLLVIFNQDPRFGADLLGLGESPIPREILFNPANIGVTIDTIGHLVGEHVMFVQEVLTELIDPAAPVNITADRFLFDDDNEIRFRGFIDKPEQLSQVLAVIGPQTFNVPFILNAPDPGAVYDFRTNVIDITAITEVTLIGLDLQGNELVSYTFLRSEVEAIDPDAVPCVPNAPPVNSPPIVAADTATTTAGVAVQLNLLANDIDVDGDPLTISALPASSANGGTVVSNGGGLVTFTPAAGFIGTDTFAYTVTDGIASANGLVAINVDAGGPPPPVNTAPIANADSATTDQDVAIDINVLGNDTDADGDALSLAGVDATSANGATVSANANGTVNYSPAAGFSGSDSFNYSVTDGQATATGTVTVTVNAVAPPAPTLIEAIVLFDAGSDVPLFNLTEGAVLSLSQLPPQLTFEAIAPSAQVESVRMTIPGVRTRVESGAPYVISGNAGANYTPMLPFAPIGNHSITVTAHPLNGANGGTLETVTINFTVAP